GLRDPDPAAAVSAFAAIASQPGWKFTRNHWRLFLSAARAGGQSANAKLRGHVAAALRAWEAHCPTQFLGDLRELLASFAGDVCASVREYAARPGSNAG